MFGVVDVSSRRIAGWSISNTMSMDMTADAVVLGGPFGHYTGQVSSRMTHF